MMSGKGALLLQKVEEAVDKNTAATNKLVQVLERLERDGKI